MLMVLPPNNYPTIYYIIGYYPILKAKTLIFKEKILNKAYQFFYGTSGTFMQFDPPYPCFCRTARLGKDKAPILGLCLYLSF